MRKVSRIFLCRYVCCLRARLTNRSSNVAPSTLLLLSNLRRKGQHEKPADGSEVARLSECLNHRLLSGFLVLLRSVRRRGSKFGKPHRTTISRQSRPHLSHVTMNAAEHGQVEYTRLKHAPWKNSFCHGKGMPGLHTIHCAG